jgi:hemoglobin-like flavoprotein
MTADQIHLLRRSFGKVERQSQVAALIFYRRLYELDPGLRSLFKSDIETQAAKLMDMLGLALSLTGSPAALEAELIESGARHAGYGARDEHYTTVGQAMISMLEESLGDEFTPATREAWSAFYALASETMKRGAAQAALMQRASSPSASAPSAARI